MMTTVTEIVESRSGEQWQIEFPAACNGHVSGNLGFLAPVTGYGASQFFTYHDDGTITWWDYVPPAYVIVAAYQLVEKVRG